MDALKADQRAARSETGVNDMKYWFLWLLAGIFSVIGGLLALFNPFVASLTANLLAGCTFMVVGVMMIISAFGDKGWGSRILAILLGLVITWMGYNLVGHPLIGIVSLTIAAAVTLLVIGVMRIIMAMKAEYAQFRWLLILSGAVSILLAFMIFSNFPASATAVLGIYLGIELLFNGVSLIAISLGRKSQEELVA